LSISQRSFIPDFEIKMFAQVPEMLAHVPEMLAQVPNMFSAAPSASDKNDILLAVVMGGFAFEAYEEAVRMKLVDYQTLIIMAVFLFRISIVTHKCTVVDGNQAKNRAGHSWA
jgi:hypothetical protein